MQSPTQRLDHPTRKINIIIFPSGAACWSEDCLLVCCRLSKDSGFKFFHEKIDDGQKAYYALDIFQPSLYTVASYIKLTPTQLAY